MLDPRENTFNIIMAEKCFFHSNIHLSVSFIHFSSHMDLVNVVIVR